VTVTALVISIMFSIGSMAWGYAQAGFEPLARWLLVFGIAWLFSQWRRWWWFSSLGLIMVILIAAFGMWLGLSPGWMFAGGIFALVAWDLTDYWRRIRFAALDDDERGMERRHISRLTFLVLAGLFLSSIAMVMRLQFNLEWVILLVFVVLLGLTQVVSWLRR
jgi:hypothetical protein